MGCCNWSIDAAMGIASGAFAEWRRLAQAALSLALALQRRRSTSPRHYGRQRGHGAAVLPCMSTPARHLPGLQVGTESTTADGKKSTRWKHW